MPDTKIKGRHTIIKKDAESAVRRAMLFSEFSCKEVINIRDCKKLGKVGDFEFDHCTGQIQKLIVSSGNKLGNFFGCDDRYVICYKDIRQIGPDIILVDIKI